MGCGTCVLDYRTARRQSRALAVADAETGRQSRGRLEPQDRRFCLRGSSCRASGFTERTLHKVVLGPQNPPRLGSVGIVVGLGGYCPSQRLLVQVFLQLRLHVQRIAGDFVAGDGLSVFIYDELGKIPLDETSKEAALLGLEVIPQRVSTRTTDINLGKEVKADSIAGSKLLDIFRCAWFLRTKLVAGEGEDFQTALSVLVVQLHQLFVVGVGLASLGSHIDNNGHITLILFQGDQLAINI